MIGFQSPYIVNILDISTKRTLLHSLVLPPVKELNSNTLAQFLGYLAHISVTYPADWHCWQCGPAEEKIISTKKEISLIHITAISLLTLVFCSEFLKQIWQYWTKIERSCYLEKLCQILLICIIIIFEIFIHMYLIFLFVCSHRIWLLQNTSRIRPRIFWLKHTTCWKDVNPHPVNMTRCRFSFREMSLCGQFASPTRQEMAGH